MKIIAGFIGVLLLAAGTTSCSREEKKSFKEEQISATVDNNPEVPDSLVNSVATGQIPTTPNAVILTGMPEHRLVTVYKHKPRNTSPRDRKWYYSGYYDDDVTNSEAHFMPGIDILYGYHLLNIAHYDMTTGKRHFFFRHSALIKTLYYPSFEQDSLNKQPINRNYYLVSVYDEDTNKDTLINRKDLRHFYHIDASGTVKTQLIPADYSVIRSQYDPKNDAMYLFASHDVNKNGSRDKDEPVHIFWFSLAAPQKAQQLY